MIAADFELLLEYLTASCEHHNKDIKAAAFRALESFLLEISVHMARTGKSKETMFMFGTLFKRFKAAMQEVCAVRRAMRCAMRCAVLCCVVLRLWHPHFSPRPNTLPCTCALPLPSLRLARMPATAQQRLPSAGTGTLLRRASSCAGRQTSTSCPRTSPAAASSSTSPPMTPSTCVQANKEQQDEQKKEAGRGGKVKVKLSLVVMYVCFLCLFACFVCRTR